MIIINLNLTINATTVANFRLNGKDKQGIRYVKMFKGVCNLLIKTNLFEAANIPFKLDSSITKGSESPKI